PRWGLGELPVGAVHLDLGDRQRRRPPGAHPDRDAFRAERGAFHHESLDRRHVLGEPVERPQDQECGGEEGEQPERQQRGGPGPGHATGSTTSKKLIQPSSTNSVWWAWNM